MRQVRSDVYDPDTRAWVTKIRRWPDLDALRKEAEQYGDHGRMLISKDVLLYLLDRLGEPSRCAENPDAPRAPEYHI